jgi:hypothetical protein
MKRASTVVLAVTLVALGVFYVLATRRERLAVAESRPFVWSIDYDQLESIEIDLPRESKSGAWIKHEDGFWYFDQPDGPRVNMERWGGGIPLLLSGPAAERLIAGAATAEQLEIFGLDRPRMTIALILEDHDKIAVEVGDGTPDGQACYLRLRGSPEVFSVHYTWYEVLERLVVEPPYPTSAQ